MTSTDFILRSGERLDDLIRDGMKIIQRPDEFWLISLGAMSRGTVARRKSTCTKRIIAVIGNYFPPTVPISSFAIRRIARLVAAIARS